MDSTIVELLLLELLLVAVLAVLSASEAALHTIRRPQLIEELAARGRRGRRAGTMGRKAVEYLASIQIAEFLIVFAFSGISAAYIAPRLSDLLMELEPLAGSRRKLHLGFLCYLKKKPATIPANWGTD